MSDTPSAPTAPGLDDLRATATAAAQTLAAAEAFAAIPVLTADEAAAQLKTAEDALEFAERPFWDVEHAQIDVNAAGIRVTEAQAKLDSLGTDANSVLREAHTTILDEAKAAVPAAQERLKAAVKALATHPVPKAEIDKAAQAVVDARAAVAHATPAAATTEA